MKNFAHLTTILFLQPALQALSAEPLPERAQEIFGDGATTPAWIESVEENFPYELQILWIETDFPIPKKKIFDERIRVTDPDGRQELYHYEVPIISEKLEDKADIISIAVGEDSRGIVRSKGEFSVVYKISKEEKGFELYLKFRKDRSQGRFDTHDTNLSLTLNTPWSYLGGVTQNHESEDKEGNTTSSFRERAVAIRLRTLETSRASSQQNQDVSPSSSVPFTVIDATSPSP